MNAIPQLHPPFSFHSHESETYRNMSMSKSASCNQTELLLNQLELGAMGIIVMMICRMWDVNAATGRYLSTDFIVSDIEVYSE
ncbi:hypothetical protein Tco_1563287 [Tanacetum coccineum]